MKRFVHYFKKFFLIFGAVSFSVVVYIAVIISIAQYKTGDADLITKQFVDEAVPAITWHWSADELRKRASREMLEYPQFDANLKKMAELGRLVKYEGSSGSAKINIDTFGKMTGEAKFDAKAKFETQDAVFHINLKYEDELWKISRFNVSSPLFENNDNG